MEGGAAVNHWKLTVGSASVQTGTEKKYSSLSGLYLLATISVIRNDFVVFTERKLPMKVSRGILSHFACIKKYL